MIWTSGGISKLEVYRKLGVREVWFYKRGVFSLHALRGERYIVIDASEALPGIDLGQLGRFVDVFPMTRAVREYSEALRSG